MKYDILINGTRRQVEFAAPSADATKLTLAIDGRTVEADAVRVSLDAYSILIGGRSMEATVEETRDGLLVRASGLEFQIQIKDPRSWRRARGGGIELEGRQELVAPMPGKIVRVLVAAGQQVTAGQGLLVIEAMKMQNEVRSPKAGTVEKLAGEGQTVNAGEVLAVVS
jgi:biotin carboxyl carrier protein